MANEHKEEKTKTFSHKKAQSHKKNKRQLVFWGILGTILEVGHSSHSLLSHVPASLPFGRVSRGASTVKDK
jgi:hypothetical protein